MLVRNFLQEAFVLNHFPLDEMGYKFTKWCRQNSQVMVLVELLRNRKGSQHVHNYFHFYCWQLNELLQLLNPSLYSSFSINFASLRHNQLILLLIKMVSKFLLLVLIVLSFSSPWLVSYSPLYCLLVVLSIPLTRICDPQYYS